MKKLFTLLTLLLCVASSAWATEETISLVSYIVSNNTASLTSTSENLAITLSRPGGTLPGPASNSRGLRWQNKCVVSVSVSSGNKINSVTVTTNNSGNNTTSIEFTLTDGTNALSGTWDNSLTGIKQKDYKWTATPNTYYASWVLTNTGSNGDLYISSITVNYETATVQNAAPTIVTQPESKVDAYVGFETTLTVGATGYPAPSYQWYANSTASNVGGTAISGATYATYTFTPTTTGTYYYYVVAINTFDSQDHTATSNVATVTVGTKYSVNFDAGNSGATVSIPPAEVFYPGGTKITLPTNHYFYLDGNSVEKWSDGENEYDLGAAYTVNSNVTFYPVFATNTKTLGSEATTITWTFSRDDGAPQYAIEGDGKTTTVIGTTENGIDLAADVALSVNPDNSNQYGKFNNSSYTNRAQVNAYTSFTIPAVKGMTVTYFGTNGTAAKNDAVTFGGEQATSVTGSTYTYEYSGEDATLTIADLQGGRYPSGVTVQYPFTGIPGPADPVAAAAIIEVATINSDGTSSSVVTPDTYNKIISTSGNVNSTAFAGYSYGLKLQSSDGQITISLPQGASNASVTLLSSVDFTTLMINGTSQAVTVTGDATNGYTTTLDISDNLAGTNYTIAKGSGAPVIYLITLSYMVASENEVTLTTTSTMQGWRAFYDANNDYTLDANTKAYVATNVDAQGESVVLEKIDAVPHGNAVLLKTTNETTEGYSMTLTKVESLSTSVPAGNLLKRAGAATNTQVYRLGANDAGVGFFAYTKEAAKPDVVVLDVDSSSAGARGLTIAFADDETTGVGLIDNGKLTIDNEAGAWYSIQGVRHDGKPSRSGLYIFNGKKVVIK